MYCSFFFRFSFRQSAAHKTSCNLLAVTALQADWPWTKPSMGRRIQRHLGEMPGCAPLAPQASRSKASRAAQDSRRSWKHQQRKKNNSSQQGAVDILPWEARPESVERTERRPSRSKTPPAPPALSVQMPQHPRISSEEGGSAAQDEPPSGSGDSSGSDTDCEGPPWPCSSHFGVD